MESASVAVDHHHHGPPEAHQSSRIDRQTLGILLFIVSEVMLFGAFFAAYFFLRVVANEGQPWPPEGFELPVSVAAVNTFILVSSSFTVHWALESVRRGNRRGLILGLAATFLLRRRLRLDLLRADRAARRPRDGGIDPALVRQHPRLARPLRPRGQGPSRRRGAGDLLALR